MEGVVGCNPNGIDEYGPEIETPDTPALQKVKKKIT
jgi:hypothetical protein